MQSQCPHLTEGLEDGDTGRESLPGSGSLSQVEA